MPQSDLTSFISIANVEFASVNLAEEILRPLPYVITLGEEAPTMATFDLLPDDILHIIIQLAPHNVLWAIAQVSKSLNRCATPYLYRYVYLWENQHRASDRPISIDWPNNLTQMCRDSDQSTRIFNLELFRRAITQRPSLRGYVIGASFECQYGFHDEYLVPTIVELLAGSAKFLHAAPLLSMECSGYFKYLTSLEIDGEFLGSNYEEEISNRDLLYDIFCLPLLVSLSVNRVRHWSCFDTSTVRPERVSTSTVKNLLFRETVMPGPDLDEILRWPQALKSFKFEPTLDGTGRFGSHGSVSRALNFSTALLPQASSLEELHVYGDLQEEDSDYIFNVLDRVSIVELCNFTRLKRVGLHLSYMMVYTSDAEFHNADIGSFPQIYQVLPPALEELQIEVPDDFPAAVFFASDPSWEVELRAGELSDAMIRMFQHKNTCFQYLGKVSFFQSRHFAWMENLRTIPGCSEMLDHAKSARLDVSWSSGSTPPLFNS